MLTLKQFRQKYNLTQKELAAKLHTTVTTLSKYENGEWIINQAVIERIKEEYGEDIRPRQRRSSGKKVWMKRPEKQEKLEKRELISTLIDSMPNVLMKK